MDTELYLVEHSLMPKTAVYQPWPVPLYIDYNDNIESIFHRFWSHHRLAHFQLVL